MEVFAAMISVYLQGNISQTHEGVALIYLLVKYFVAITFYIYIARSCISCCSNSLHLTSARTLDEWFCVVFSRNRRSNAMTSAVLIFKILLDTTTSPALLERKYNPTAKSLAGRQTESSFPVTFKTQRLYVLFIPLGTEILLSSILYTCGMLLGCSSMDILVRSPSQ